MRLPIYQEYRLDGKRYRRTLKTRNWQKALADACKKEMQGFKPKTVSPSVKDACDKYIADAEARQLRPATIYKFRLLFRQLQQFAESRGLVYISDFNVDNLREFRASWPNRNHAARKKLENLRGFFRFCHISNWISTNPVLAIKPTKTTDKQIVPIAKEELAAILKACDKHHDKKNRIRLKR